MADSDDSDTTELELSVTLEESYAPPTSVGMPTPRNKKVLGIDVTFALGNPEGTNVIGQGTTKRSRNLMEELGAVSKPPSNNMTAMINSSLEATTLSGTQSLIAQFVLSTIKRFSTKLNLRYIPVIFIVALVSVKKKANLAALLLVLKITMPRTIVVRVRFEPSDHRCTPTPTAEQTRGFIVLKHTLL